jgi:hypothetical protein
LPPLISGGKLGDLKVESNRQNTNLDEPKRKLVDQVKQLGGNASENFNYVQKGAVFRFRV